MIINHTSNNCIYLRRYVECQHNLWYGHKLPHLYRYDGGYGFMWLLFLAHSDFINSFTKRNYGTGTVMEISKDNATLSYVTPVLKYN